MLTVTAPPATTGLTTLERVKDALEIVADDEDAWIGDAILKATGSIADYLDVPRAADGSRSIGRQSLSQTFRLTTPAPQLLLARWPVVSIASVVEAGATLAAPDYEFGAAAVLQRLSNDAPSCWSSGKIVVAYVAGWLLPGDEGTNLDPPLEAAALELIKIARSARRRDPLVKTEDVAGVIRWDYWVGGLGDGTMPPQVAGLLDPYRFAACESI